MEAEEVAEVVEATLVSQPVIQIDDGLLQPQLLRAPHEGAGATCTNGIIARWVATMVAVVLPFRCVELV